MEDELLTRSACILHPFSTRRVMWDLFGMALIFSEAPVDPRVAPPPGLCYPAPCLRHLGRVPTRGVREARLHSVTESQSAKPPTAPVQCAHEQALVLQAHSKASCFEEGR